MDFSIILGLIQNIAILLTFSLIYDLFWEKEQYFRKVAYKIFLGIILGTVGIILMITPWEMVPGLAFDTRSVLLLNTGLFFGPITTLIVAIITGLFRIYQGGAGTYMGLLVIIISGAAGLIWKHYFPEWRKGKYVFSLAYISIIDHVIMLVCTLALPLELIIPTLKNIALPILTIYPASSVLLGTVLVRRMDYWKNRRELLLSEERQKTFMDANKDCMFVKDENLKYIIFNKAMARFLGKPSESIYGRQDIDLVGKENAYQCSESDKMAINSGGMIINEEVTGKKIYKIIKFPLKFADRTTGVGGIIRDVTESRKKGMLQQVLLNISQIFLENISLKEFLRRSHIELKKIMVADNMFIAIYDAEENKYSFPYFVDEFDQFESDEKTSLAHTLTDYIRITAKGKLVRPQDEEEIKKEYELVAKGAASPIWMAAPLFDLTHKNVTGVVALQDYHDKDAYTEEDLLTLEIFAGYVGIYYDQLRKIEDLKKAKVRAEESDRLKTAFLANVSHEIRTPMNSIIGFTDILMNEVKEESLKEYVSIINKSAYRLLGTVNDVIDMAKIESGQKKLYFEDFNLMDIINYLYHFYKRQDNNRLINPIPSTEGVLMINTDKTKLIQIFSNLISNAIKFAKNGKVDFGFYYEDGYENDIEHIIFFVKDTGMGINKENLEKIFDRFYQVENTLAKMAEGTGLGLSIVKEYVTILGGKIWVKSESGSGTTFYFQIKLKQDN